MGIVCVVSVVMDNKIMKSMSRTLTAIAVFGLLLTGCSSNNSMDMGDSSNSAMGDQSSAEMADIAFAQMMIPHHEQAVVMSEFALTNTDNVQVLALAQEIIDAQGPEIEQMNAILDRFGANMGGHGGHTMAGMLTDEELGALQAAQGPEFDQLFLMGMIAHHEGAIAMANDVLASGSDPEVRALAEAVVAAQQSEIEVMQKLLAG
jgi:uncharacterized protein (DUF305 family)